MLIGLVDPSHSYLKAEESGRLPLPRWYPLDEVLEVAANAGPKWSPWTFELLAAALDLHEERGERISTSLLTSPCPRSAVLERMADYIGDVRDMYPSMRGSLIHLVLEPAARPRSVAEVRFYTTLPNGEYISGTPDLVTYGPEAAIWDYKTTENPPTFGYPYKDHTLQVQTNRFIVNNAEAWEGHEPRVLAGKPVPLELPFNPRAVNFEHVVVVYLGPKGPKPIEYETPQKVLTPRGREVTRKMPNIWSDDQVLDEIMPRVEQFRLAFESYPDFPEELVKVWGGGPDWRCPGYPVCRLPKDLAKRWPDGLTWESP